MANALWDTEVLLTEGPGAPGAPTSPSLPGAPYS